LVLLLNNISQRVAAPADGLVQRAHAAKNKEFDLSGTRRTMMCVLPFNSPTQEPDGAVRLCSASSTYGYVRETNMGDYTTQGLANVWRGEKYRHVRKTLLTGEGLEPFCDTCEYRFPGEAWMLQLHMALYAWHGGSRDPEVAGLIRRWAKRHREYAAESISHGLLAPLPMPDDLPRPGWFKPKFNTGLPEVLIDASTLPVDVDFNTLNRCNVSCIMCPPAVMHDDKDIKRDSYYRLSIEDFTEVCEGLNVRGAHFVGAYAEPLLNKDIFKLLTLAKRNGAITAITTNATALVPQFADKLLDTGIDTITVSLHGATKATAESIMRKADFDRVIRNIRHLQQRKKERGLTKPMLLFNFVSQLANVHEIPDFVELAADLGISYTNIIHLIDGGLDDKSTNLTRHPHLVGPAIVEAKRRAKALGMEDRVYFSPVYAEIVAAYEAAMPTGPMGQTMAGNAWES
jgi:MoaA/NifB/PqqE/SkfB family radical SAM enzyme